MRVKQPFEIECSHGPCCPLGDGTDSETTGETDWRLLSTPFERRTSLHERKRLRILGFRDGFARRREGNDVVGIDTWNARAKGPDASGGTMPFGGRASFWPPISRLAVRKRMRIDFVLAGTLRSRNSGFGKRLVQPGDPRKENWTFICSAAAAAVVASRVAAKKRILFIPAVSTRQRSRPNYSIHRDSKKPATTCGLPWRA